MTSISALIQMVAVESVRALLREPMTDHTAREFNLTSNRIATACAKLVEARAKIAASTDADLIDAALSIENELDRLKDSMRGLRREILRILSAKNMPSPVIHNAITSLRKAAEDTYTAANQLQWEIAEHDASYVPRGEPMIATNQEELDKALNSIRGEK